MPRRLVVNVNSASMSNKRERKLEKAKLAKIEEEERKANQAKFCIAQNEYVYSSMQIFNKIKEDFLDRGLGIDCALRSVICFRIKSMQKHNKNRLTDYKEIMKYFPDDVQQLIDETGRIYYDTPIFDHQWIFDESVRTYDEMLKVQREIYCHRDQVMKWLNEEDFLVYPKFNYQTKRMKKMSIHNLWTMVPKRLLANYDNPHCH